MIALVGCSNEKTSSMQSTVTSSSTTTTPDTKDAYYDEEFAGFVNKQGLDTELIPLMTRAIKLYGGLDGLSAQGYPSSFSKGADGECWGIIYDSVSETEKQMSISQTIDLLSEVFDRTFAETKFYDSYYLSSDGESYLKGDRGSDLSYHGHYFELISESKDTIEFKCICLSGSDPDNKYFIHFDEDLYKWIIDYYYSWNEETQEYDTDYAQQGKIYEPKDTNAIREYTYKINKIDGAWKFTQFELWC